ncbi:hypothetical protein ACHAPT_008819 [Fusarium lateritium]
MSPRDSLSIRARTRLIVGIDYGTTYSGLSFAMSSASDFKEIRPWTAYPGSSTHRSDHCEKAPSLVAFAAENDELDQDAWGYQVEPDMKTYAWTKLLLDGCARESEYDDPGLKKAIGSGIMKLPRGHTAKGIVTAYLRGLNTMYQDAVADKLGEGYLDNLPVDFWLTVPATWSDEAKQLTLDAARDAGFASRLHDRIRLISEPEAAAHLALKSSIHHVQDLIEAGTRVMVCDLGGGTVDITSYEVQSTSPKLKLRELCVGGGGKCGGTFVDRNFHKLMERRFGKAFTSLEPELVGPGSQFMDQFEMAKRDFSAKQPKARPHRLNLFMESLEVTPELKKHYNERFGHVFVSHEDLRSSFDPVGDMIIDLVSDQVKRAKRETTKSINHMVLVGGFGSSPYIKERLQEWCQARHIRLTTPWSGAWSAVVCGAVLRGIEGGITTEKRCRRYYGHRISYGYDQAKHGNYNRATRTVWRDHYRGRDMLDGFVDWFVSKNEVLDSSWSASQSWFKQFSLPLEEYTSSLYACSSDEAPETYDNDDVEYVGEVKYTLEKLDLSTIKQITKKDGSISYQADLDLNVRMSDEDGLLEFRIMHEGKECGKANLSFSYSVE